MTLHAARNETSNSWKLRGVHDASFGACLDARNSAFTTRRTSSVNAIRNKPISWLSATHDRAGHSFSHGGGAISFAFGSFARSACHFFTSSGWFVAV